MEEQVAKNPISEMILDRLADGASFNDLKKEFRFSRTDFVNAAVYGVSELREEYIGLVLKKMRNRQGR
jgi:uncharacterized protein (DUF433 family)